MASIHNYTILDDLGNYDKELNPNRLSVIELLPKGVSWLHNGKKIEIKDDNKIVPVLLLNGDEIALIKAPYDKDQNKAYIIDAEGNIKWDVKDIINKKTSDAIFYDAYYIYDELFFFLNIRNCDYRFSFDTKTGICGNLLQTY
jgi:hypothetical protein